MAITLTPSEPARTDAPAVRLPGRLPFQLPDFCRVLWASAQAREVWSPRIGRFVGAWNAIERASVAERIRPSALQIVAPEQLPVVSAELARHGLLAIPLERTSAVTSYSQTSVAPIDGRPWAYRVAIARADLAAEWTRAWRERDDDAIGGLLGYPACCRRLFVGVWSDGLVDPTWPMAVETSGSRDLDDRLAGLAVDGPREANILLRWLGVRLVPHMPCAASCRATAALGAEMAAVGRAHGFGSEVTWAEEMLDWPVEWSALHGIAEIKTPVCKISTRTDATAGRLVVQRPGPGYPDEGATGNVFPYRPAAAKKLTDTRAYADAFVSLAALRRPAADPAHEWNDNGFASLEAMQSAHDTIARVAPAGPITVLDLGCGNGRLAQLVARGGAACGIESDAARAARARARGISCVTGNLSACLVEAMPSADDGGVSWPAQWDVVLLMPGRLIEMTAEQRAAAVATLLGGRARTLLVYAYGDWITRHGSLEALTRAAGLPWSPREVASADQAAAALIEVARPC